MGILQAVVALRSCAGSSAGKCSPTNWAETLPQTKGPTSDITKTQLFLDNGIRMGPGGRESLLLGTLLWIIITFLMATSLIISLLLGATIPQPLEAMASGYGVLLSLFVLTAGLLHSPAASSMPIASILSLCDAQRNRRGNPPAPSRVFPGWSCRGGGPSDEELEIEGLSAGRESDQEDDDRENGTTSYQRKFDTDKREVMAAWGVRLANWDTAPVHARTTERRGDGHCLFYSLLQSNDLRDAKDLRNTLADHIAENFDTKLMNSNMTYADIVRLELFEGAPGDHSQRYRDILKGTGSVGFDPRAHWGGFLEIHAYCRTHESRVDVYELAHKDTSGARHFRLVYSVGATLSSDPINLHYDGRHWENLSLDDPSTWTTVRRRNRPRTPPAPPTPPTPQPERTNHRLNRRRTATQPDTPPDAGTPPAPPTPQPPARTNGPPHRRRTTTQPDMSPDAGTPPTEDTQPSDQRPDGDTLLGRTVLRKPPGSGGGWRLGTITEATPPREGGNRGWTFRATYETQDGDTVTPTEDLSREQVEASRPPDRRGRGPGLQGRDEYSKYKRMYEGIRAHLQAGTFSHQNVACLRTAFNFTNHDPPNLAKLKTKLRTAQRDLHPDKVAHQPAHVRLLAKRVYGALTFLYTSTEQQERQPADRTANDPPSLNDYPAYNSDEFAAAASTEEEPVHTDDLTPPEDTTPDDDGDGGEGNDGHNDDDDGGDDDEFDDLNGPTTANPSLLGPDGSIPNTFESVNAFHMNDFTLSNLKHVLWVPRNCVILWCQVYGEITMKLLDAIRSSGPDRHRRIGTAARWYLGMPQIFLNDKGNYVDNQTIIERRLTQFLAGDFAGVLTEWRKAKDRARRRAKPPKQDTHPRRVTQCIKLFFKGYVSRGLRVLTGHGRANPEDPSIVNQMKEKHPPEIWDHEVWTVADNPSMKQAPAVVRNTPSVTGVGARGFHAGHVKQLYTAKTTGDISAKKTFEELGQAYLSCQMPTWLRRAFNGGLLTPLVKKPATAGETPDARPTNARDIDVSIWLKTIQRQSNTAIRRTLIPQQLAVAVKGGCEIKVIGSKLKIEQALKNGLDFVLVCLDLKNAHNEFSRSAAQDALDETHRAAAEAETSGHETLKDLAQAHRADTGHAGDVYMRDSKSQTGFTRVCTSTAGGPQGSPLTNLAFPALINKALKATEAKFPGVELRAIQDDIDASGPPDLIFGSNQDGSNGALHFLLEQLAELDLKPNKSKFQFYATTERAAERAPSWLPRPFYITDPDRRAAVDDLEAKAAAAANNARSAPPGERESAEAAAAKAKEEAEAARADVPNECRAHGVITCGAALGDAPFIAAFLEDAANHLCNDIDAAEPGVIASVVDHLSDESAHCASTAIYYSLQCRVDYLLGTHLPSETRGLADKVDEALRKAYTRCFGIDLLNPEGTRSDQTDPTFCRDLMGLKAKAGGMGYRNTARRSLFVNALSSALPQMMGDGETAPLWASLGDILGSDSFTEANADHCWQTFFNSGSAWATEFQSEIDRLKALHASALEAAGLTADPDSKGIFDKPNIRFGHGVDKLHRKMFDEIRSLEAKALLRRARRLMPNDPRKLAFEQSRVDKFSNTLFGGTPDPLTPLTTAEFRSAVQNKAGAPQSTLAALVGYPIDSNSAQTDRPTVDPSGYNLKKVTGAIGDGTRQNHNAFVDRVSEWLARAKIPHMGGKCGNPRTCKGLFSRISYRLSQLVEEHTPTGTQKVLQRIIPDLVLNGRGLCSVGPLANKKSLADIKTLSPCNKYAEHRDGKPNAVVNDRQRQVDKDYHHRAKELDAGFGGDSSDGFEAELSSYGKRGKVLGPVVGAYGEMSDDVYVIAEAVAEELATEHCGFYSDKKQGVVAAFFLSQIYRSWGLVAHRGWARLMLDRRCLVEVPNAPRHRAERAHAEADYDEETARDNYFNPPAGHRSGPGGPTDA